MNRRWFQIHLSTAIVIMFVAGAIMYVNVRPPEYQGCGDQTFQRLFGWPCVAYVETSWYSHGVFIPAEIENCTVDISDPGWNIKGLATNGLAGMTILIFVIVSFEIFIRRHEAAYKKIRAPDPTS
jgi:hypothetical protein